MARAIAVTAEQARGPGDARRARRRRVAVAFLSVAAACGVFLAVPTQGASPAPVPSSGAAAVRGEESPLWRELKPAQQAVLEPLRSEWSSLDSRNKRKWVELAARFPNLAPDQQQRVQARMAEWARMTPAQRGEARLHYQQARQIGADERRARWDAYQALPPEEKQQLAERSSAVAVPVDPTRRDARSAERASRGSPATVGTTAARRPISPALVQATPGASTTLIDRRPTPPEHQRSGTRIQASPDEINRTTLSPRHRLSATAASAARAGSGVPGGASSAVPAGVGSAAWPGGTAPGAASAAIPGAMPPFGTASSPAQALPDWVPTNPGAAIGR